MKNKISIFTKLWGVKLILVFLFFISEVNSALSKDVYHYNTSSLVQDKYNGNESFDYGRKFSPPVVENTLPILNANLVRYVVINNPTYPFKKMEIWKFDNEPITLNGDKTYYGLLSASQKDGSDFTGTGRYFREEDSRFYQYISETDGERILYDMNLVEGDSIRIDYADGPRLMVVTKSDSVQLDDLQKRKRLTLRCVIGDKLDSGDAAEWIEGIGRLYEPFTDFSHCSLWDIARPEVYCIYNQGKRIYKSKEAPSDCWIENFYTTDMDSSATWYSSSFIGNFADGDCRKKIDITKVVRDTTIQYRTCRIIGVFTDGEYLPESEIITFQKADKLYFYENDTWKLLYDFAAQVGDTVTYYISEKYPYYARFLVPSYYDQDRIDGNPYQLIIKGIDSTYTSSGKPLKRFQTENVFNIHGHYMGEIIYPIGSTDKLFGYDEFFLAPSCYPPTEWAMLRCYEDDDIYIKFTDGECDILSSVRDIEHGSIQIYPNPGMEYIYFKVDDKLSLPLQIKMRDISGRVTLDTSQDQNNFSIKTQDLAPGLYIISIQDQSGKKWYGKWVKE